MFPKSKTISVIGMGHVGLPLAVHYYNQKHKVQGVDINTKLVNDLKRGITTQTEPGIYPNVLKKIHFQTDLPSSDIYEICVDVPEKKGQYDPKNLLRTIKKILKISKNKIIIVRSTIDHLVILFLKKKLKNEIFATILFSPEFLREGHALHDLVNNPNYYGIIHKGSKTKVSLPSKMKLKIYDCNLLTTLKISCNAWRATKVSFANMLLQICNKQNIDYENFYKLFVADELNVSSSYMKGGTPFGGYCLPKETRILSSYEKVLGSSLLNQVMRINERMVSFWTNKIIQKKPKRIIFDSLSFKARVNDKRNSALLSIYNKLESLGFNVKVIGYNFQLNNIKRKDLLVTNNNLNEYQNISEIIKIA